MDRISVEIKAETLLKSLETAQMRQQNNDEGYFMRLMDKYLKLLMIYELRQIGSNIDGLKDTIRAQGGPN